VFLTRTIAEIDSRLTLLAALKFYKFSSLLPVADG
jgi:hypothetical protein